MCPSLSTPDTKALVIFSSVGNTALLDSSVSSLPLLACSHPSPLRLGQFTHCLESFNKTTLTLHHKLLTFALNREQNVIKIFLLYAHYKNWATRSCCIAQGTLLSDMRETG